MKSIERLYEGSIDVPRRCGRGGELRANEAYIERHRARLLTLLPPEERVTLEKLCECGEEQLFLYGRECYMQGFALGTRLTAEALLEEI